HSSRDKLAVRPRATTTVATPTKSGTGVTARTGVGPTPRAGTAAPALVAPVAGAPFNHATVAGTACVSCHTAASGSGKPPTHLAPTDTCQSRHTTLAWKPARIDHSGFTSGCATCHNNGGAVGLSPGHMVTRLDCATCHSFPDWSLIRFRHTSAAYPGAHRAALSCTSCHTSNTDRV